MRSSPEAASPTPRFEARGASGAPEALNRLLEAQSKVKERQVTQQNAGAGQGQNRQAQDLSSLFDKELARHQQTNYETKDRAAEEQQANDESMLDRIRELAKRQDELLRRQQELAKQKPQMTAEDLKRALEKLSREQEQLREQAERMARQMSNGSPNDPGQQNRTGAPNQQGQQNPQNPSGQQQAGQQPGGDKVADRVGTHAADRVDLLRHGDEGPGAQVDEGLEGLLSLVRLEVADELPAEARRALGTLLEGFLHPILADRGQPEPVGVLGGLHRVGLGHRKQAHGVGRPTSRRAGLVNTP